MRISDWSSDVCSSDLAHFLDDRLGHMHHRAISEDGQRLALTHRRCLAEFDAVIILGHRARIMLRPRLDRTVVIAAERAVVDALGLEEYDGVIVLDRSDARRVGKECVSTGRSRMLQ